MKIAGFDSLGELCGFFFAYLAVKVFDFPQSEPLTAKHAERRPRSSQRKPKEPRTSALNKLGDVAGKYEWQSIVVATNRIRER